MHRRRGAVTGTALLVLAVWSAAALALEYRSVGVPAAILYDAPSAKANRISILGEGYPVEILVTLGGWLKVRDADGALAWVEAKNLSVKRMLMVRVARADIRSAPQDDAPLVFQADRGVLLEFLEMAGAYARVRHDDGATGYVAVSQVWGL